MALKILSSGFENNARMPARYSVDGANVSPPLSWQDPPGGVVSWVLIVDDPDAPRMTFTHWVIYNLPGKIDGLPEGVPAKETLPDLGGARQGINDFGKIGYGGPAPPRGPVHHYHFRLYALDANLTLGPRAGKADVERAMKGHILAQAELVGLYRR
jgi:hypothetical protein